MIEDDIRNNIDDKIRELSKVVNNPSAEVSFTGMETYVVNSLPPRTMSAA
jgi:hypothetical protein